MLNLVELGSNYLLLLLIMPKMRSFFISGENYQVLIETKISRAISRKIRVSRKPRAPKIAKQQKTGHHTGVQQGCTAVHPGQKPGQPRKLAHGQPCLAHGPCVRPVYRVSRFLAFLIGVFLHFWRTFPDLFRTDFREKLRVSIASTKLH